MIGDLSAVQRQIAALNVAQDTAAIENISEFLLEDLKRF
jgi:hypothetical protein